MRISDWSSDVCSSDLHAQRIVEGDVVDEIASPAQRRHPIDMRARDRPDARFHRLHPLILEQGREELAQHAMFRLVRSRQALEREGVTVIDRAHPLDRLRSEEHTSELQSLMRISYVVFCLHKKK